MIQASVSAYLGGARVQSAECAATSLTMRSKRKRTVVKLDSDYVDLDSDELDQLIEEDEPASRKKQSSRSNNKKQKQAPAAAAAAGVDPDDEEYTPDEITDAAEAPAAAAAAAAGAAQDAEVAEDSAEYFSLDGDSDAEDGDADGESSDYDSKPAGSKKAQQQPKEKKPRKKRQSTRRLCASYAKAEYHLTDKDLAELTDIEYKRNPHYRSECTAYIGTPWPPLVGTALAAWVITDSAALFA